MIDSLNENPFRGKIIVVGGVGQGKSIMAEKLSQLHEGITVIKAAASDLIKARSEAKQVHASGNIDLSFIDPIMLQYGYTTGSISYFKGNIEQLMLSININVDSDFVKSILDASYVINETPSRVLELITGILPPRPTPSIKDLIFEVDKEQPIRYIKAKISEKKVEQFATKNPGKKIGGSKHKKNPFKYRR